MTKNENERCKQKQVILNRARAICSVERVSIRENENCYSTINFSCFPFFISRFSEIVFFFPLSDLKVSFPEDVHNFINPVSPCLNLFLTISLTHFRFLDSHGVGQVCRKLDVQDPQVQRNVSKAPRGFVPSRQKGRNHPQASLEIPQGH
eukprot:NP_494131.1 Uncharacterized protein CELE_F52C6.13 [Caenorhabditis elegans]